MNELSILIIIIIIFFLREILIGEEKRGKGRGQGRISRGRRYDPKLWIWKENIYIYEKNIKEKSGKFFVVPKRSGEKVVEQKT